MKGMFDHILAKMPQEIAEKIAGEPRPSNSDFQQDKASAFNAKPGNLRWHDCPTCRNKGIIAFVNAHGLMSYADCACRTVRRSKRNLAESGMTDLLARCTFGRYTTAEPWQQAAKGMALKFANDHYGKWFCALGSVGSGKTHLCSAICYELLITQGLEVRYMPWRDKSTQLKTDINTGEYAPEVEKLKNVDVLYIDDFFKTGKGGAPTDADIKLAHEILNARYNDRAKVTLISSEWTVEQLLDFDEAVGSRIYERGKEYTLTFTGGKNQRLT